MGPSPTSDLLLGEANLIIIPKHTFIGSNQLQIQEHTVSLFASACLTIQTHEVNHKTILDLYLSTAFCKVLDICGYIKFSEGRCSVTVIADRCFSRFETSLHVY